MSSRVGGSDVTGPGHAGSVECGRGVAACLLACGRGDERAFGQLFDAFYPLVRAQRGADEAVLTAFARLWQLAPSYTVDENAVVWVLRVASFEDAGQRVER